MCMGSRVLSLSHVLIISCSHYLMCTCPHICTCVHAHMCTCVSTCVRCSTRMQARSPYFPSPSLILGVQGSGSSRGGCA
jgi:hypothetical protein